jgi:glutamine amidotransferase
MENLKRLDLCAALREAVQAKKKPFLGICLGMHLIAESSTEMGLHEGLGMIRARVLELRPGPAFLVPHVGWNDARPAAESPLFENLPKEANFYFDHSYHLVCDDPHDVAATCEYGGRVVAAVRRENLFATQFHPEKSQTTGLKLLRNFLRYVESRETGGPGC